MTVHISEHSLSPLGIPSNFLTYYTPLWVKALCASLEATEEAGKERIVLHGRKAVQQYGRHHLP